MSTTYRGIVDEAYVDRPYPPWLVIGHSSAIYLCFATRRHLLTKDRTETFCSLFCASSDDQCRGTRHLDFFLFCTSSFVGGKGTDSNDTIVVKASGGQTLTMVYIYYGIAFARGVKFWAIQA